MGGGLMQLVAYGSQDVYLTGNPQITFWKVVYRRHTNFALESVVQTFNGNVKADSNVVATISRNGDLIHKCYLEVTPNSYNGNSMFNSESPWSVEDFIDSVELEIGGQQIDRHTGQWMDVWNKLSLPKSKRSGWNDMMSGRKSLTTGEVIDKDASWDAFVAFHKGKDVGGSDAAATTALGVYNDAVAPGSTQQDKDAALVTYLTTSGTSANGNANAVWTSLPTGSLVKDYKDALVYSTSGNFGDATLKPKLVYTTGHLEKVFIPLEFFFCTNPGLALPLIALQYHEVRMKFKLGARVAEANLWVDYVYLDTDERRKMAQSSHEFLITQLQHQEMSSEEVRLNFNHPVKELVWKVDSTTSSPTGGSTCKLTLNGHERAAPRDWKYYQTVQPFQHHTSVPDITDYIGVYSFALKPEESQPSGSCNFSRIDNAQLKLNGGITSADVYATNWNVLRIMSGMGGLAYSN